MHSSIALVAYALKKCICGTVLTFVLLYRKETEAEKSIQPAPVCAHTHTHTHTQLLTMCAACTSTKEVTVSDS
jgi:hypothetical protein